MNYSISELTREDMPQAVELMVVCFGENYRDDAISDFGAGFADYLYRPKTFIAKAGANVIGLVQSITGYIGPNLQAFCWLATHPDFRRQGIGAAVLAHAEQEAITRKFKNRPGTFLLIARDADYYRKLGYKGGETLSHNGLPFLVKQYQA